MTIIGSEEWCSFEEFGIITIKARIDSGAKTSSIQANNIKIFRRKTEKWVSFEVFPIQGNNSISVICKSKIHARRLVKSSMGISEKRIVIKTPITIGDDVFDIELTLANNRDSMEFRMLLGREAFNKRYLIDSSETFLITEYSQEDLAEIEKEYQKKQMKVFTESKIINENDVR